VSVIGKHLTVGDSIGGSFMVSVTDWMLQGD